MARSARPVAAFTLVEMLVVIGVTALLLGLLLPALSGARNRSAKTGELNDVRQVGYAWNLYANQYGDATLPGYIAPDVQPGWKVKYTYPSHDPIPPEIASTWVWRLLPFLDYNHQIIHGYLDEANPSIQAMVDEADEVSLTPAFGYNGFMIGGWWEMVDIGGSIDDRPRFWNAERNGRPVNVLSRSIGSIRRSTEVVVFCSAGYGDPVREVALTPGSCDILRKPVDRDFNGSHYVTPPMMGGTTYWNRGTSGGALGSTDSIQLLDVPAPGWQDAFSCSPAPVGRHSGQVAVLYADNHVDSPGVASLVDQRKWIDGADDANWTFDVP